jgi:hypothetical protein
MRILACIYVLRHLQIPDASLDSLGCLISRLDWPDMRQVFGVSAANNVQPRSNSNSKKKEWNFQDRIINVIIAVKGNSSSLVERIVASPISCLLSGFW